ncbi:mitochondrial inner membrane protease subunit 1 [Coccinella septempunctata]|uniref:mitochondrial inner membrane protease subunit 1 n=1 Tax=Coccinella septempunctata TaxID=41139 RepID=UPI001D088441|nr:mitochondrial inner membrane protease subunit 1 [Coccinella septempunctata]
MEKLFWKLANSTRLFIQYGCVVHCFFQYVGDLVLCSGPSMEPTIFTDDIIITEHITPRFQQIQKGDIVIAKCPHNPLQNICKRVKGLPGDKVYMDYGRSEIVPIGHIWLEGDNSSNSTDSRNYGAVPQGLIKSRVLLRVYPFSNVKTF